MGRVWSLTNVIPQVTAAERSNRLLVRLVKCECSVLLLNRSSTSPRRVAILAKVTCTRSSVS